jgi:hypothetical protein
MVFTSKNIREEIEIEEPMELEEVKEELPLKPKKKSFLAKILGEE